MAVTTGKLFFKRMAQHTPENEPRVLTADSIPEYEYNSGTYCVCWRAVDSVKGTMMWFSEAVRSSPYNQKGFEL